MLKLLQHATHSFKKIKLKNTNSVHNCYFWVSICLALNKNKKRDVTIAFKSCIFYSMLWKIYRKNIWPKCKTELQHKRKHKKRIKTWWTRKKVNDSCWKGKNALSAQSFGHTKTFKTRLCYFVCVRKKHLKLFKLRRKYIRLWIQFRFKSNVL